MVCGEIAQSRDFLPDDREDCDFGLLWETQKDVLELIYRAGNTGVSFQTLAERYGALAAHYPELCDGIPFIDWVRWMQEAKLIASEATRAAITEKGRFILYDLDRNHAFADHRCI
jgi:hypothetical protein